MKKIAEEFDGFEIVISSVEDNKVEACLFELPHIKVTGISGNQVIADLKIKWEDRKKECVAQNEDIPISIHKKEFSGQFNTRIEPLLHKMLVREAHENKMSLNELVSRKLWRYVRRPYDWHGIDVVGVESSEVQSTVTIYVADFFGKIGLTFFLSNLRDVFSSKAISNGSEIFNYSSYFKERIKDFLVFLSSQTSAPVVGGNSGFSVRLIKCFIVGREDNFSIYRMKEF